MILPVEGATTPANRLCQMSDISYIDSQRVKNVATLVVLFEAKFNFKGRGFLSYCKRNVFLK